MLFHLTLHADNLSQLVFIKYCVYNQPFLSVSPCNATDFDTNNNISAILNVSKQMNITGWMYFSSKSNPNLMPKQQMRAVGYAEGFLFADSIANHFSNIKAYFLKNYITGYTDYPPEIDAYFKDNLAWTRKMAYKGYDPYWRQVSYTMAHFDGLVQGYQQTCNASTFMSEIDMFEYMSSGDLLDVVNFAIPKLRSEFMKQQYQDINDHCSGAVRITKDKIFVSQTAWFTYGSMTRVDKEYIFDFGSPAKQIKFSSYPGFSYSFDDWYQTDSGLMFVETTHNVFVEKIYSLCKNESLMTWIRAPIAGRMARDAEEFSIIISKYNSGTYNNQWIVADMRMFENDSAKNVVWVTEQIPGVVASYDATEITMKQGYFPSYNIPSQAEIYKVVGYPAKAATNHNNNYSQCARAKIFARDAPNIQKIEDMQNFMRYNDYLHDNLSLEVDANNPTQKIPDPSDAISSRYDLRKYNVKCFGGFDNKIGEYDKQTRKYTNYMISSPANMNVTAWKFPPPTVLWCPRNGLPDGPYNHDYVDDSMTPNW